MIREVSLAPSCRVKRVLSPTSAAWSSTSCGVLHQLRVELGQQRLRLVRVERREGETAVTVSETACATASASPSTVSRSSLLASE